MQTINRISFVKLAFVTALIAACDRKSTPQLEVASFNEVLDPETLGYFSLPKADDPSLRSIAEIPEGNYSLTMIQSYTISHGTKISAAFEQKLQTAARPMVGDLIRFEYFRNGNADNKEYRLAAQLNLPLTISVSAGTFAFGTIREYWNQVLTIGQREWALNTKPNATAINPSIEETLKHPTGKKGIFSHMSLPSTKNTVYLTVENSKFYAYLKTQLKNETSYVRLEYTAASAGNETEVQTLTPEFSYEQSIGNTDLAAASELVPPTEVLRIPLELETISGGEGAPSLFGSATQDPSSDSKEGLEAEIAALNKLKSTIESSSEIKRKIADYKIDRILIANPYKAVWKTPGVMHHETGTATLVLKLGMTEAEILQALESVIGEEISFKKPKGRD